VPKIDSKTLVQVSLLIALEIVLSRFLSIATPIVKIGFGFVPIAVCAMLYGPVLAGAAGGLADFIGAILFPIGPYFPGFTLSAALTGAVFGVFLYRRENKWRYLAAAVCINCLVISLGLSTFWIHALYGTPLDKLIPARALQNLIMIPIQFTVLRLLRRPLARYAHLQP
jgi:ECF transporter S component (folate family)